VGGTLCSRKWCFRTKLERSITETFLHLAKLASLGRSDSAQT
jgi:hypothetical protein